MNFSCYILTLSQRSVQSLITERRISPEEIKKFDASEVKGRAKALLASRPSWPTCQQCKLARDYLIVQVSSEFSKFKLVNHSLWVIRQSCWRYAFSGLFIHKSLWNRWSTSEYNCLSYLYLMYDYHTVYHIKIYHTHQWSNTEFFQLCLSSAQRSGAIVNMTMGAYDNCLAAGPKDGQFVIKVSHSKWWTDNAVCLTATILDAKTNYYPSFFCHVGFRSIIPPLKFLLI